MKSPISNPKSSISNPKSELSNFKSEISNPQSGSSNLKSEISNPVAPLPKAWRRVRLDQALEIADSGVWGEPDPDNGMSILRSTNFRNDGTFDLSDLALRAIPAEKRKVKVLTPGDIVLERSGGGPKQPVGRVCFFEGDKREHSFGNFCQRLRARSGTCDARFLFWHLYFFHLSGQTQLYQRQTTGIRNLEYKPYLAHELALPPLAEQKRIAAILKEQLVAVDKARAAAQARLEAVRALPAAFLRQVFPQPGAPLPKGWRWVQLDEIGPLTDGDWILNSDYAPAGVRLLQVGDVGIGQFVGKSSRFVTTERAKELKCTFLEVEDILISRMPDPIGRACQLPQLGYVCITAVDVSIWRPDPNKADRKYLVYYLSSPMWFEHAKASASGATRPRISRRNLESLQLPMPHLPEQSRIAGLLQERLGAVDKARTAAEEELATVNTLPAALLRRAFSGEL